MKPLRTSLFVQGQRIDNTPKTYQQLFSTSTHILDPEDPISDATEGKLGTEARPGCPLSLVINLVIHPDQDYLHFGTSRATKIDGTWLKVLLRRCLEVESMENQAKKGVA